MHRVWEIRRVFGSELQEGDTIEVWWKPNRDTITALRPYEGPLKDLFASYGGARLADFAILKTGMTIGGGELFTLISRIGGIYADPEGKTGS